MTFAEIQWSPRRRKLKNYLSYHIRNSQNYILLIFFFNPIRFVEETLRIYETIIVLFYIYIYIDDIFIKKKRSSQLKFVSKIISNNIIIQFLDTRVNTIRLLIAAVQQLL